MVLDVNMMIIIMIECLIFFLSLDGVVSSMVRTIWFFWLCIKIIFCSLLDCKLRFEGTQVFLIRKSQVLSFYGDLKVEIEGFIHSKTSMVQKSLKKKKRVSSGKVVRKMMKKAFGCVVLGCSARVLRLAFEEAQCLRLQML